MDIAYTDNIALTGIKPTGHIPPGNYLGTIGLSFWCSVLQRPGNGSTKFWPTGSMSETDEKGQPNLCCCFIMDAEGNIEDPCLRPATEYCLSGPEYQAGVKP